MVWKPIDTAPVNISVLVRGEKLGYSCATVCSAVFDNGWWPDQWEPSDQPLEPDEWMEIPE